MTRGEILHLAEQVGCGWTRNGTEPALLYGEKIVAFAALVAAAEREACSKVCDAEGREWDSDDVVTQKNYAAHCAAAIRARGEK